MNTAKVLEVEEVNKEIKDIRNKLRLTFEDIIEPSLYFQCIWAPQLVHQLSVPHPNIVDHII